MPVFRRFRASQEGSRHYRRENEPGDLEAIRLTGADPVPKSGASWTPSEAPADQDAKACDGIILGDVAVEVMPESVVEGKADVVI